MLFDKCFRAGVAGLLWVGGMLIGLPAMGQITVDVGSGNLQNTGTSYPAPYGNWYWGARHQMMVRASELNALGISGGQMTSLSFFVVTPEGTPLSDFTVSLGTTPDSVLSTTTGFVGGLTQVYTTPAYTEVPGWNTHAFAQPFFWNGTSNLIVETCFNNLSYTNNAVMLYSDAGYTSTLYFRRDSTGTCSAAPGGISFFSSNNRSNMRFTFLPLTGTDAAATALINPAPPVLGGATGQVIMRLSNFAANTITSATVGYRLNNGVAVTETWNGSLPSGQTVNHTFTQPLSLPLSAPANVEVWVTNPTPGPDINSGNDTFRVALCYALAGGSYTVGPGAGAAFASLHDAIQAMRCGGITGPVTLQLQSGVHLGSYSLSNIQGLSSSNTLTITSLTGNASDVVLLGDTLPAGALTNRTVFTLQGCSNVRFQHLTLRRYLLNASPTGGNANTAHISATQCNFLQVSQCILQDSVATTFNTRTNLGLELRGCSNTEIVGNTFTGFDVALNHSTLSVGVALSQNLISGNSFSGYRDAVTATGQLGCLIASNQFEGQRPDGNAALSLYDVAACEIHSNRFRGQVYNTQILVSNASDSGGQPTRIYNNAVSVTYNASSAFGAASPIRIEGFTDTSAANYDAPDGVILAFNTVYLKALGALQSVGSSMGLIHLVDVNFWSQRSTPFGTLVLRNNNLMAEAGSGLILPQSWAALRFDTDSMAIGANSDYQNLYLKPSPQQTSPNTLVAISSPLVTFATCSSWTAAYGEDSNSVALDPLLIGINAPIPSAGPFNNLGIPYGGIGSDLTGAVRNNSAPDLGAYEFTPAPNDLGVIGLVGPVSGCGLGSSLTVTVRVVNFGSVAQTNFGLGYSLGTGAPVSGIFSGTLNPGDSADFTFNGFVNLSTPGNYEFVAYTSLGSDGQTLNDTNRTTVISVPLVSTMPYTADFESGSAGWRTYGTNSSWQLGTPAGPVINSAGGGTQSWTTSLTGDYNNNEWSYLESPCLDLSTLTAPEVRFKVWWDSEYNWDGLQLQYSTNGGANWTVVGTVGTGTNWYNNTLTNGPGIGLAAWNGTQVGFPGNTGSGGWLVAKHPIPALAGQNGVLFRFMFVSDVSVTKDGVAVDDFRVSDPPPVDAAVRRVTAPSSGCGLPNNAQLGVLIKNFGSQALQNLPVRYRINTLAPVQEVMPGPIAPGDSMLYQFTTLANLSTPGTYGIQVYTAAAGDADLSNDTLRTTVTHIPTVGNLPYRENLEAGNGGWTSQASTAAMSPSSWAWGIPTGAVINNAASGQRAWVTNLSGSYNDNEVSYLNLPCLNFGAIQNATLSFSLNYDTEPTYDGVNVEYSTNGGSSWQVLGTVGSGTNWYTSSSVTSSNGPVWDGASVGWIRASHSLAVLNNAASARLRFVFTSDPSVTGEGIGIDSLQIVAGSANVPDIGVVQVLGPNNPLLNANNTVKVVIRNYNAGASISNFLVSYAVNGALVNGNTLSRSIQPGDTIHHTFTGLWRPTVGGTHRLCAYTGPIPGQTNSLNDTFCRTYTSVSVQETGSSEVVAYPNPARDRIYVRVDPSEVAQRLVWRDAGGRLIQNLLLSAHQGTNEWPLNESGTAEIIVTEVGTWSPGLYFGTLSYLSGQEIRFKVRVQP